jgi:hypothetical protein
MLFIFIVLDYGWEPAAMTANVLAADAVPDKDSDKA